MISEAFSAQNLPTALFGYTYVKMIESYPTHIIFHATDTLNIPVIIYLFNLDILNKLGIKESIQKRLEKLKAVVHPNIVSIQHVQIDEMMMFLVTEDLFGTNLDQYVMSTGCLSDNEVLRISKGLFDACTYLHGKGIFHGNIRPENILFDAQMNPKLSFFGFSENAYNAVHTQEKKTLNYVPPEVFKGSNSNPITNDVWALGIIVYVMQFGDFPFNQLNQIKQINSIIQCSYTIPKVTNTLAVSIISRCLTPTPEKRTTCARISVELRDANIQPYRNKISRGVAKSHTCVSSNGFSKIELLAKQGLFQFRRKEIGPSSVPQQSFTTLPPIGPGLHSIKKPLQSSVF